MKNLTARRENGMHYDTGTSFANRWVVRDKDGKYIAHDKYRNDLLGLYPDLVIIGE